MKFKANVSAVDIIGHLIVWLILGVITFGIAFFFFPYSFSKFILNRSAVVDDSGLERKLKCDIDLFGSVGHVILWIIISILTFGIGYMFYFYKVWNYALNNTQTVSA